MEHSWYLLVFDENTRKKGGKFFDDSGIFQWFHAPIID